MTAASYSATARRKSLKINPDLTVLIEWSTFRYTQKVTNSADIYKKQSNQSFVIALECRLHLVPWQKGNYSLSRKKERDWKETEDKNKLYSDLRLMT